MKSVLLIILLIACRESQAQLPDYYVYLVSGEARITNAGKTPVVIKQKQLVYNHDMLMLKKGAEVTLVDKEAGFYVVNTAGTNKVSELIKKITPKNNDGLTSKYLKLLFHELLDPNQDFEKLKKENIAGVWGGVSRGDECGNRIFPVNGLQTSSSPVVFKWHKTSPSSAYSFVIYDAGSNELVKMNTTDTLKTVSINETLQGKAGKIFLAGNQCGRYMRRRSAYLFHDTDAGGRDETGKSVNHR
ncbi:MAG: hypothetical protein WDO16_08750 [Bacteroidota bacterium]